MRTPRLNARVIRGRAARRGTWLLLAMALSWTALGSHIPSFVRTTASDDGSSAVASKPIGIAAAPFSPSASDGKIAFTSGRNGDANGEIYVMNADGTNQVRLTNNPADDRYPAFAPSGSKIAFASNRNFGADEIYLMNADGTNQVRLTNDVAPDFVPAFAPFVSKIAFVSRRDGNAEIYVMNDDGTNQVRLTNNAADDQSPAFSPFGNKIAFTSKRNGNSEIYVMNDDGTNQVRLTNNTVDDRDPAFAPFGNKITFASERDGNLEIFVMNDDGTNPVRLTNNPADDDDPVFNPDGTKIAFASDRDTVTQVYVMNADGTNQTRLTNNFAFEGNPSWAPGNVVLLSVNDVSVAEGNSGTSALTFTVTKTGPTTENVTVVVDTIDLTADDPGDYAPVVNQQLTFLPTDTTKTVTVTVNGDTTFEPNETFFVNLRAATNALIPDELGIGTIINDDGIRTLPNLVQVVIFEQTNGPTPHVTTFAPNASQLLARLTDPLTSSSHDFSQFDEEYYDFFYSDANGSPNPDGTFVTIEGVWRNRSIFCCAGFGGMNINEVELRFQNNVTDRGDFVSSFVIGSICNPGNPDTPEQCIPGSEARAVDNNTLTFPRFGHTSNTNLNERFRLTIGFNGISPSPQGTVQFGAASFDAAEGAAKVNVTATRTGDTSSAASVKYATTDSSGGNQATTNTSASERRDYTASFGTLRFAPGETTKTIEVLITDDVYNDDGESFQIALSDAVGATLGVQNTATVQISDNDSFDGTSPVRDGSFNPDLFVRQAYADFLGRVPDQAGLNFWMGQTTGCGHPDLLVCRINVSAAFFLSIEFQETSYLAYRTHKAAFGNLPGKPVPLTLRESLEAARLIGEGVQVGIGNWEQQLEANKVKFFDEFVNGSKFASLHQNRTHAEFVDALNLNVAGALSQVERDSYVSGLTNGTMTRAKVLRAVVEDSDFVTAERNRAFVLAQYFGYLRRDPDSQPDNNFDGYNFWLAKLDQFGGNFINAEMVKAFIQSTEFGDRFGL